MNPNDTWDFPCSASLRGVYPPPSPYTNPEIAELADRFLNSPPEPPSNQWYQCVHHHGRVETRPHLPFCGPDPDKESQKSLDPLVLERQMARLRNSIEGLEIEARGRAKTKARRKGKI